MNEAIEQIKKTIDVLSFFEMRHQKLREELDFFKDKELDNNLMHVGALIRLNHEVMYLCVDVYSLHQGISLKKSLYKRIIKNNGSILSKVDKTEHYKAEDIITSPETTDKERVEAAKFANQEGLQARKSLQQNSGITSPKDCDLDQWLESIQDEGLVQELNSFRQEFAHRLDSLDNMDRELKLPSYEDIDQRLSVVSKVMENYKKRLQDILGYTNSTLYEGYVGIEYDSISRLKQYIELEPIIERGINNISDID
jgi:hypothetical protein